MYCGQVHLCPADAGHLVYKRETPVTEELGKELTKSPGFGYPGGPDRAAKLELPVTSYSGGCKIKVQLCAAQLMNCDVLLLDEPTGHLDVDNIKWFEDWLESFTGWKLKTFERVKANTVIMFVKKYPENKAYFELSNETMKFAFLDTLDKICDVFAKRTSAASVETFRIRHGVHGVGVQVRSSSCLAAEVQSGCVVKLIDGTV